MRYFYALNIKDTEAYRSVNARLIYLHLCCLMDYQTRDVTISTRALASDLELTHKAVRCALEVLLTAGLIGAHNGAHNGAQATTYTINTLGTIKGTSEGTSEGTQINKNNIKYTLSRAREEFLEFQRVDTAARYLCMEPRYAEGWVRSFLAVQELREREGWRDTADAWQHMLDWIEKKRKGGRSLAPPAPSAPPEPPESAEGSEASADSEPTPPGWSSDDWKGIKRLVQSGQAAPAVVELYQQTIKNWDNGRG